MRSPALFIFAVATVFAADARAADWAAVPPPDQSDWSPTRIAKHATLHKYDLGDPEAVLRVPGLGVAAVVYADTHPMALEAGAAWVSTTAYPGELGNAAIAGHRDSYFRPLEDIPLGTRVEVVTDSKVQTYVVDKVHIVDALDVSVLAPTEEATLTLITCHPFRFEGYAPDRYIIHATLVGAVASTTNEQTQETQQEQEREKR